MKFLTSSNFSAAALVSAWKAWCPVISLAFAAFIFNTTEFVPIGLLPAIAHSFSIEIAQTGLLITGYAWMVALMSLPLTLLSASLERRKLLLVLFCLFIGSHIAACLAQSFAMLMLARMGIACAHAVFWSITIPLAARLAPNGNTGKALALMVTGSSLATVLGVPIGTFIGQHSSWRITFLGVAIVALFVLLVLLYVLPKMPSTSAGSFKSLPLLLKRKALTNCYVLTVITVSGYFTVYSFITPFMLEIGAFSEAFIVYFLLFMGFSGIIGSFIFTHYSTNKIAALITISLAILLFCLLILTIASLSPYSMIFLGVLWGAAFTMIMLTLQTQVLSSSKESADIAMSIYSGIFNIGIGAGALIGSTVLTQVGIYYIGFTGAIFVALAFIFSYFIMLPNCEK